METPIENLMRIIQCRRSVRKYDSKPISDEALRQIVEAARLAPSSNNTQPWRFIAVTDAKTREALSEATPTGVPASARFIAKAPLILVCCAKPHLLLHRAAGGLGKDYHAVDVAIAVEHLVLAATALGIGTCWVGWFSEKKVREILEIPSSVKVVALIPLGYPLPMEGQAQAASVIASPENLRSETRTPRHELKDILCQDRWML